MSRTLTSKPVTRYGGRVRVPGDKSISHRALMIGALADADVEVMGLAPGLDVRSTVRGLDAMGVRVDIEDDRAIVHGVGLAGLRSPDGPIDCGNSATTMRLLAGIAAGARLSVEFTGDESLILRPMGRVVDPLRRMGAIVKWFGEDGRPPFEISSRGLRPTRHRLDVASAQVKSAILLAGLFSHGMTEVEEPAASRDHTERMLKHMGVAIEQDQLRTAIRGPAQPVARPIHVPGDVSSAAFLVAAAPLIRRAKVTIEGVGLNPTRTGFLEALRNMGARFATENVMMVCNEPVGDLIVRYGQLKGCVILGRMVPRLIDEVVALGLMAACATGRTAIKDAVELRHKESDRIEATVRLINALGGRAEELEDGMVIEGLDGPLRGGEVDARGDHRVALAALAIGPATLEGVVCRGAEAIEVSYPSFLEQFESIRGRVE